MICIAKSNSSLIATIAYNEKYKSAQFYVNKLVGDSIADYLIQMTDLQECYKGHGKQLTIHAILSPCIEDGQKLSDIQWKEIADKYLQKMNLEEHQTIGYIHTDKGHKHLHLVINKVNETDFKLYNDSFIGKKSQKVADAIAQEMHLVRARVIQQNNIEERFRNNDIEELGFSIQGIEALGSKQQFRLVLEGVIYKNTFENIDDYFNALEKAGLTVHRYINKTTGKLRGYGVEKNHTKMDASAVGREFTLKSLNIAFGVTDLLTENGTEKIPTRFEIIKQFKIDLESILHTTFTDSSAYFETLRQNGFNISIHLNDNGILKDYSIEKDAVKVWALDLDKKYSLQELDIPFISEELNPAASGNEKIESSEDQPKDVMPVIIYDELKKDIKTVLEVAVSFDYKNANEYFKALEASGLFVKEHYNKQTNELRGYSISMDRITYLPANEIAVKFTLKNLNIECHLYENSELEKKFTINSLNSPLGAEDLQNEIPKEQTTQKLEVIQQFKVELDLILQTRYMDSSVYFETLKQNGFKISIQLNDNGNIKDYSFEKSGVKVWSLDLNEKYSLQELDIPFVTKELIQESSGKEKIEYSELQPEVVMPGITYDEFKKDIKTILDVAVSFDYKNADEYFKVLEASGLFVKEHYNKQTNELRGYSISKDGKTFISANEISAKYTLKKLDILCGHEDKNSESEGILSHEKKADVMEEVKISVKDLIEIKSIGIIEYLKSNAYIELPTSDKIGNNHFKLLPQNLKEKEICVDKSANVFFKDLMDAEGNIVQLVQQIKECDAMTAIKELQQFGLTIKELSLTMIQLEEKTNHVEKLTKLFDPKKIRILENYALSMGIARNSLQNDKIELVQKGKNYFIGIRNDSGGYTVQNILTKRNIGLLDITTIINEKGKPVVLLESMFDYLKLNDEIKQNVNFIVLNSFSNLEKAINKIKELNLPNVFLMLKSDEVRNAVVNKIKDALPDGFVKALETSVQINNLFNLKENINIAISENMEVQESTNSNSQTNVRNAEIKGQSLSIEKNDYYNTIHDKMHGASVFLNFLNKSTKKKPSLSDTIRALNLRGIGIRPIYKTQTYEGKKQLENVLFFAIPDNPINPPLNFSQTKDYFTPERLKELFNNLSPDEEALLSKDPLVTGVYYSYEPEISELFNIAEFNPKILDGREDQIIKQYPELSNELEYYETLSGNSGSEMYPEHSSHYFKDLFSDHGAGPMNKEKDDELFKKPRARRPKR